MFYEEGIQKERDIYRERGRERERERERES